MIALTSAVAAVYVAMLVIVGRATVRGVRAGLDGAAVRWGELLGPAEPGQCTDLEPLHASNGSELSKFDRHRFRLAARREARP